MKLPLAMTAVLLAASAAAGQEGGQLKTQPAPPRAAPLFVGEKLRYTMTILGVAAGEIVLSAASDEHEGRPAYRLEMTMSTNDVVSKLYYVHDSLRSWVDPQTLASLCFDEHTVEGRRSREETAVFDLEHLVVQRDNRMMPMTIPTFDAISSVYFLRTLALEGPEPVFLSVVGKNVFTLQVSIEGREMVTTPAGTFRTIRLEPKSPGESSIGKGKNLILWVTDDQRKLPVQIKSRLSVGTLVGKLKAIE
jgi:hypothetical protein